MSTSKKRPTSTGSPIKTSINETSLREFNFLYFVGDLGPIKVATQQNLRSRT
jgi:hypothetical protein